MSSNNTGTAFITYGLFNNEIFVNSYVANYYIFYINYSYKFSTSVISIIFYPNYFIPMS